MATKAANSERFSEEDFSRWKLIRDFGHRLDRAAGVTGESRSEKDPRRLLSRNDYFSLLLFGLFNPVVESMRGLCAASKLDRVQQEICSRRVSLGSFSEAQGVFDPDLLREVMGELVAENSGEWGDPRLARYKECLQVIDSTLWHVVPRMAWAQWRHQHKEQRALRLHLKFKVLEQKPVEAVITEGKKCERAVFRKQMLKAGEFYVADRYYAGDYEVLREVDEKGCGFLMRLRESAKIHEERDLELDEADREAGVVSDTLVRLGGGEKTDLYRLVIVEGEKEHLLLITNQPKEEVSAELIALIYRYRWQVELFFRWLKCLLPCRHWFCESEKGVVLQVYCALIAALLLARYTGRKPRKREMELLRFYLMGYASVDELEAGLEIGKKQG